MNLAVVLLASARASIYLVAAIWLWRLGARVTASAAGLLFALAVLFATGQLVIVGALSVGSAVFIVERLAKLGLLETRTPH